MKRHVPLLATMAIPFAFLGCDGVDPAAIVNERTDQMVDQRVAAEHTTVRAKLLIPFNEAAAELPEGIAIDKRGNIFISIAPLGQLWRLRAGSRVPEVFGAVRGIDGAAGDVGLLGLEVDAEGNVYAGVSSANPDANGVWKFDRKTGETSKIEGSEAIGFPNDVTFDKRGNLYITDSALGAVWRVPKHGELELWLAGDENLAGTGILNLGVPVGANGIEYRRGVLYVANTEKALIVRIPVEPGGNPGPSSVFVSYPFVEVAPGVFLPGAPDGLAFDVHGNLYVAQINLSTITKVAPSGDVSVVLEGDPLDWPSSIAFGTRHAQRGKLFAVNFSIGEGFGDTVERVGPGLVGIRVSAKGMQLPYLTHP